MQIEKPYGENGARAKNKYKKRRKKHEFLDDIMISS